MTTQAAVEDGLIHCPEPGCGFEYMHPVGVTVNSGGVITDVDRNGTRITRGLADGRGVTILVRFVCEDGHESLLRFHFHKGSTEFESIPTGEAEPYPHTIWRD
jgi:hypothetical protein